MLERQSGFWQLKSQAGTQLSSEESCSSGKEVSNEAAAAAVESMYTNAVARATSNYNAMLECEAFRASCSQRLKKADSLLDNAVAQAAADVLRECEAPRVVRPSSGAPDGLLTNFVFPGDDANCDAAASAVASSPNAYANAVMQATVGRDVFHDTGTLYLVHAQELVPLREKRIEEDLSVEEEGRGQVPWILARSPIRRSNVALQPSFRPVFSSFDLELLPTGVIEQLVAGARDANTQAVCPQIGLTACVNQSGRLSIKAAKVVARRAMTGPPTPEIMQDRVRSPSLDSVPSLEPQQDATCSTGNLLRIAETCAQVGAAICRNPLANVPTKDQQPQAQEAQPKVRKRKYMPKVRRPDKPKRASRAKKPRRAEAADNEDKRAASLPTWILETRSLTLLQMKTLARHKTPQLKQRRRKRDEAEPLSAQATGTSDAPLLDAPAQQIPDGHNCDALRSSDPLSPRLEESQIPLAVRWSSDVVRLEEWNPGSNLESQALIEACSSLPGFQMSRDELRNVLEDPLSAFHDGPLDFHLGCAPDGKNFSVGDEDLPSTPRGPTVVSVNQFFVTPPWSPPSPHCASHWAGEISHTSATSTRRNLNFDVQEKEQSESTVVEVRKEPAGLIPAMAVNVELSLMAEGAIPGFELQVTDQEWPVPKLSMKEPVPLAMDSSLEEELKIVPYNDMAKKLVVYKHPRTGKRRDRYKPKVHLDFSTVKMFNTLMLNGAVEDDTEQDKASWEESRQQWQNRARRFIKIMRQVQGNRAFSRWKGSVVDSVGGVFLTQNVSDFLSSNAFMALRARFPARSCAANEGTGNNTRDNTTPQTTSHPSIEKTSSSLPRPERSTVAELKSLREAENHSQKEASEKVFALASIEVDHDMPVDEALTDVIEEISTRLRQCRIEQQDRDANAMRESEVKCSTTNLWQKSEEVREAIDTQQRFANERTAMEGASVLGDHALITQSLPPTDIETTRSEENPSSISIALVVFDDRECTVMEEATMSSSVVPVDSLPVVEVLENRAVIQEKFSSVVPEESLCSLTVVGKEKVLATTLRLILGKKQTTTTSEGDKEEKAKAKALKIVKLRPQRAVMRRRVENYRYRQGNNSYKLLSGEARAEWEAGFLMKSQKEKWEPFRASILADASYSRDPLTADCVDWEAVHRASVHEVAGVIKNRGMNNALAGRMKAFLDRLHRDQNGSIDLEWIRKLPPDDAKAYLLSFRGVGLKSVECIRLLSLHHPSFPVDTNVGRIAVRLGWVPLEPLPEETQLHLLEMYPIQAHIQQYIWPRICTLDQQTLYELHYQMITFGKVFCTKSKPNCNACPLRSECKHYASSYASAKLLLKWPDKQEEKQATAISLPQRTTTTEDPCIPIIEEPFSPELFTDSSDVDFGIPDIEEVPFHMDYTTVVETQTPRFSLIIEEISLVLDLQESLPDLNNVADRLLEILPADEVNMLVVELEENEERTEPNLNDVTSMESSAVETEVLVEEIMDLNTETVIETLESMQVATEEVLVATDDLNLLPSQELILLPPQSTPAPLLKNVQRLRTVHFVYELPDNHPLLFEMDPREADDPCFYLLAIWSPDEIPAKIPKIDDDEVSNPFASCEDNNLEPTVRGTLLIPCKTAMRGSFPLNGTYFQVNEVFADHASSVKPIDVPRTLLWSLRRRFVYFSTAVSNLFKGMSQEEIRCCFQKGYVCLRAFDLATRQPKVLAPRLHQSGAKIVTAPISRRGPGKGRPRKNQTTTTQIFSTEEAPPPVYTTTVTNL